MLCKKRYRQFSFTITAPILHFVVYIIAYLAIMLEECGFGVPWQIPVIPLSASSKVSMCWFSLNILKGSDWGRIRWQLSCCHCRNLVDLTSEPTFKTLRELGRHLKWKSVAAQRKQYCSLAGRTWVGVDDLKAQHSGIDHKWQNAKSMSINKYAHLTPCLSKYFYTEMKI